MVSVEKAFLAMLVLAVTSSIALATGGTQDEQEYKYGNMTMYLARAGKLPWALKSETQLEPSAQLNICPTDFKRGFTIRCEPTYPFENDRQRVDFYVNGKYHRNQVVVPYYLNGNTERKVRAYFFGRRTFLKIMCESKGVRSATVIVRKRCEE